jgi:hypothetical protein
LSDSPAGKFFGEIPARLGNPAASRSACGWIAPASNNNPVAMAQHIETRWPADATTGFRTTGSQRTRRRELHAFFDRAATDSGMLRHYGFTPALFLCEPFKRNVV